jgi:hypothetical protein
MIDKLSQPNLTENTRLWRDVTAFLPLYDLIAKLLGPDQARQTLLNPTITEPSTTITGVVM